MGTICNTGFNGFVLFNSHIFFPVSIRLLLFLQKTIVLIKMLQQINCVAYVWEVGGLNTYKTL